MFSSYAENITPFCWIKIETRPFVSQRKEFTHFPLLLLTILSVCTEKEFGKRVKIVCYAECTCCDIQGLAYIRNLLIMR